MQSSPNTFLDFDGTLVCENSSRVLMQYLARTPRTRRERWATRIAQMRWRPVTLVFGAITRLSGERDVRLFLLLWAYRQRLKAHGPRIFAAVAAQLTLNPAVAAYYTRPFAVASTGLRPVIEAFLDLHPELECAPVLASELYLRRRWRPVHLLSLPAKVRLLQGFRVQEFITDYSLEATVFERLYGPARVKRTVLSHENMPLYHLKVRL